MIWGDLTTPEPELKDRRLFFPYGKVVGGSSSINGMVYIRGQKQDYDYWNELGNEGWSYQDILPYFKRAENQQHGANDYHGVDGPIHVHDHFARNELLDAYIAGAREIGIPTNLDFNGVDSEGAGYYQLTSNGWRRSSTAVGYLRPARLALAMIKARSDLRMQVAPFTVSPFHIRSQWHKRFEQDNGTRWLRDMVVELFYDHSEPLVTGGATRATDIPSVIALEHV